MNNLAIDLSTSALLARHVALAPTPRTPQDTGLHRTLLEDLLCKTLLDIAISDTPYLVRHCALSSPVIELLMDSLRADGRVEVKAPAEGRQGLRYALTNAGRNYARDALDRSGYVGPAPVPAQLYEKIILEQSVRNHRISATQVEKAFSDTTIDPQVLNQLGAAMHSGKGIFVYGAAGSGKTFICQRLSRLLGDPVLIPHAVSVDDSIINVLDPALHTEVDPPEGQQSLMLDDRYDPRFQLCERPFICSGGELSADLLEVRYDKNSNRYQAPLQLKASNGIYLIDDLGRQRITTTELFNRWIVPMESRIDYLNMQSGARLELPFDLILIFSTNLNPNDLADAAFLRRIGHKIRFEYLDRDAYSAIWTQVCVDQNVESSPAIVDFVIDELHAPTGTPLLACHPRDLVNSALDYIDYLNAPRKLDEKSLRLAWNTNFVLPV